MANAWARHLPIVTVPSGAPKRVTLVLPYYENPVFVLEQQTSWLSWPRDVRLHIRVIIVDDGSPTPIEVPRYSGIALRVFRIGIDLPWNWLAARNIGAHHAEDGWLLLTDMDHLVPPSTIRSVVYGQHDPSVIYAFSRREHTGAVIPPHSASFLMTRELFWVVGGYDETLSGHYGTDGDWRRRCRAVAPFKVLRDALTRFEYVLDSSTRRYARNLPADADAVQRLIHARGPDWRPKILSFPYREVTCSQS